MRIGEIRKIIKSSTNTTGQLVVDAEALYGGQAYIIKNFNKLVDALEIVSTQAWNDISFENVAAVFEKFPSKPEATTLNQADYNTINGYVNSVNAKMTIFSNVIDSLTEDQNPQVINIKLPDKINTLKDLSTINSKLEKLFKEFSIDGEIKLVGFDRGSDWYIICLAGLETYRIFIAALKIAQEYFTVKKNYYESKQAELDYKAGLNKPDDYSEKGLKEYQKKRLNLEIEDKVSTVLDEVTDRNGHAKEELFNKLIIATKELIKEMGEGVEFHLSLNPPAYASEEDGELKIDYIKIREELNQKTEKTKQIEAPSNKSKEIESS